MKKNNPIGAEKPHVYLTNYIKKTYGVVLEIEYVRNTTIAQAYYNLADARIRQGLVAEGVSICSARDNFNKKLGLIIALRRLNLALKQVGNSF
jgi:hypothetical protein